MLPSHRWIGLMLIVAAALAGCGASTGVPVEPGPASRTVAPATASTPPAADQGCQFRQAAYPANSPDGNHFVPGVLDLTRARRIEVELGGSLEWVVGLGSLQGSRWLVSDAAGRIHQIKLEGEQVTVSSYEGAWPQGAPLAVQRSEQGLALLAGSRLAFSPLSHPILGMEGQVAAVGSSGRVVLEQGGVEQEISLAALPDARLLSDGRGQLLLYTDPTDRYRHGALGDELEASALTLIEAAAADIVWSFQLAAPQVFEGLAPLWVDLGQEGHRLAVTTVSDASEGARYLLVNSEGQELASSPAIGQGYRWRHAIAAAPLGPDGEWELVGVRTPHLGGVVEYFQRQGDTLELTAELAGFSSHQLGSRNLDQALVSDFDADGAYELLVPRQDLSSLAVVGRTKSGAALEFQLDLGSAIVTNLAVACHRQAGLALAAGLRDGTLVIWIPTGEGK